MNMKKALVACVVASTFVATPAFSSIRIPAPQYKSQAELDSVKKGCDHGVYMRMYGTWASNANYVLNNTYLPQIQDQVKAAPAVSSCIDGALGAIKNAQNAVGVVMNMLATDFSSLVTGMVDQAINQAMSEACRQANSYVTQATNPIVNASTNVTNRVYNSNIQTPYGQVDAGSRVVSGAHARQNQQGGGIPIPNGGMNSNNNRSWR